MPRVRVSIEEQAASEEGVISITEGEGAVIELQTVYVTEGSSVQYVTEDGLDFYVKE